MCNVDEDSEKGPVPRATNSVRGQTCMKCDQPGILIIRTHDAFCRDCFMVYVIHKFRSVIGKSRLIRDGEHVLVAFSGGANSASLVNLISDGLSERAHKKLRFRPTLLYVDGGRQCVGFFVVAYYRERKLKIITFECTLLGMTEDERCEVHKQVTDIMISSGFPAYVTSLEQALQKDFSCSNQAAAFYWDVAANPAQYCTPSPEDQHLLKKVISSLRSTTCKEDFVKNLRKQLLLSVAKNLDLKKVITGECSTRLAVQTLTDMAQGRGSQAALDTAFSDNRNDDVMIVRPLKDLTTKELALYSRLCCVDSVTIPNLTTKAPTGASIERLTENFVTGLQVDYPATVSNIVRTSQKLLQPDSQDVDKCTFCQSPLDTKVGTPSAFNAIRFSKKLSELGCLHKKQQQQQQQHKGSSSSQDSQENTSVNANHTSVFSGDDVKDLNSAHLDGSSAKDAIMSTMCFGCQLSLRDFGDDLHTLPPFISSRAQPHNREKVKEELSNFLLDEEVTGPT